MTFMINLVFDIIWLIYHGITIGTRHFKFKIKT
jgi:hypothetical protein